MVGELKMLPDAEGRAASLLETVDLVVPHQANKTMVTKIAEGVGLTADQLYFNIERVGNVSAASIPLAIYDAVADGVIERPVRVFAPGFGAGAVGGYAVMRIDPQVVARESGPDGDHPSQPVRREPAAQSSEDVRVAFGD